MNIDEINYLHDLGYQEVVLLVFTSEVMDQISMFSVSIGAEHFQQTSVPRIRLGSLDPCDLEENFFTLLENKRLCTHLHLPLQSGSNSVLKRMIRRCTVENYKTLVQHAKKISPLFHISTDLIIGFPGESEREFLESVETIQEIPFGDMHLFTYSPREGTTRCVSPIMSLRTLKKKDIKIKVSQTKNITILFACLTIRCKMYCGKEMQMISSHDTNELEPKKAYLWKGYTNSYIRVQTKVRVLFNQITPTQLQWNKDLLHGIIS